MSDLHSPEEPESTPERRKPITPAPIPKAPIQTKIAPRPGAPAPKMPLKAPAPIQTPNLAGPDSILGSHRNTVEEDLADESLKLESDASQRRRIRIYVACSLAVVLVALVTIIAFAAPAIHGGL